MKIKTVGVLSVCLLLSALASSQTERTAPSLHLYDNFNQASIDPSKSAGAPIVVDCGAGQSLSGTLANLNKLAPPAITVKGTCTEYVVIDGFNQLTVNGAPGAALQQPETNPQSNSYLLSIHNSRGVSISGLAVHSLPTIFSGIGIGGGSQDVQLKNVTVDGSWGVVVYEASQVWLVNLQVTITSGYAAVSAFDKSDVHMVNGMLERAADSNWYAGIAVGSGHVTMQGTVIRDMQQSIDIYGSGSVDLVYFDQTVPPRDVVLDNPAGTNFNGVYVGNGSSLNISTPLRINNAGQSSGWDTGGILVTDGSTMIVNGGASLTISGSHGQGVMVANDSHADLTSSSIVGGGHGGLVVVSLSTATVLASTPLTVIGKNATDLFCDSTSQIAGSLSITSASTVQCTNLLQYSYGSLP